MSLLLLCGCVKTSYGYIPASCAHYNPHFIANERQAVLAALAVWNCISRREKPDAEKRWLDHFGAVRKDGIWHVFPIIPEGYAGGGANIFLREKDASLVDIWVTQ
jgi:hypothetical protein